MIKIHTEDEFVKMRAAGRLAAILLAELGQLVRPGITTKDLDNYSIEFCKKYNTKSACFGYHGRDNSPFPAHICTSVNHVVCHGIPSEQTLEEGDIIGIDITLIVDGYHGDTCATFPVGQISKPAQKLLDVTFEAMNLGISASMAGNHIGDIGATIVNFINKKHNNLFGIVTDYCGHGIGQNFHQEPEVQHIGRPKTGPEIKEGMFFTVEPMINLGKGDVRVLKDNWTVISKDYSLSAQFEHTIGIGQNGPEIFTKL